MFHSPLVPWSAAERNGHKYKDETGMGLSIFVFPIIIAVIFELLGKELLGYVIGGIVLLVLWLLTNPAAERKYNRQERARVVAENQRIDAYNEQFKKQLPARCSSISSQIARAERTLAETRETLHGLYSLEIIFPKYRNLTAIISFYEYFCSGRCSELTGHEGAYNIFEQEVRMGIVVDKLDVIIERLEQIENNQYMLTNAIRESNKRAEQIYGKMCECADKLQSIDENVMVSGYFNAITAANTSYLARYCKNT